MLVFLPVALATNHLTINEFVSDPSSGNEWVEIFNPTENNIELPGCYIFDGSNTKKILSGTIYSNDFYVLEITSSLLNNDGDVIVLNCSSQIIDKVAYGNYNDGNILDNAPVAADGKSTGRIDEYNDTGVDINDFTVYGTPTKASWNQPRLSTINILVSAIVKARLAKIASIILPDDDSSTPGIQIMPEPGEKKNISIIVELENDKNSTVTVEINGNMTYLNDDGYINATTKKFSGTIYLEYYDLPQEYNITVGIDDNNGFKNSTKASFEYLSSVGMIIDSTNFDFDIYIGQSQEILGDSIYGNEKPTIKNIGNSVLDMELYGTNLRNGSKSIPVNSLRYSFGASLQGNLSSLLSTSPNVIGTKIVPGRDAVIPFSLMLNLSNNVSSGSYLGSIFLTSVTE